MSKRTRIFADDQVEPGNVRDHLEWYLVQMKMRVKRINDAAATTGGSNDNGDAQGSAE